MGVEYKHFLISQDPSFIPGNDVIIRIDDVLSRWNLKKGDPKIYDLSNGINKIVTDPLDSLIFGQGLAIEYPGIEGVVASNIMGRSYYDNEVSVDERYIERMTFIVGLDFRIHPSGEELTMTVKTPPLENKIPITPYCENDEFLHYGLHAEAYHSSASATPPKVDVWVADNNRILGGQNFLGFWRTALIID